MVWEVRSSQTATLKAPRRSSGKTGPEHPQELALLGIFFATLRSPSHTRAMPMPSREQIEEAMGPMHPGNCFTREEERLHLAERQVIATLRLAIAAERIADALECVAGAQDPLPIGIQQAETVQPTAPDQLPTCVSKGWIHGVTPSATCLAQPWDLVKVYVPSRSTGWELRTASLVTDEDLWAPMHVDSSPLFKKLTLRGSGVRPEPGTLGDPGIYDLGPQPVASLEGWRTGCPSAKQSSSNFVEVRNGGQLATLPNGRTFRVKPRLAIGIGEYWAPINLVKSFLLSPPVNPGDRQEVGPRN